MLTQLSSFSTILVRIKQISMSNQSQPNRYSEYPNHYSEELSPRKRKKKKQDGERMWLGIGCLIITVVGLGILLASVIFWLADSPQATPELAVITEPSATPTLTPAPTITLTFTPVPTFTPQGLFLTTTPISTADLPTLAPQLTPVPLDNRVIDLIWPRNTNQLITASSQGVWVLALANDISAQKLSTSPNRIVDVALSRDEKWLAVAYADGFLELWGIETLLPGESVTTGQTIFAIEFSPTEDVLATTLEDGTIVLWSVDDLAEITRFNGDLTHFSLAYRADGQQLAVGGINSRVDLWNISTGEVAATVNADHVGWVIALDYAANGQWVASSGEGGAIFVTDSTSGERLYTLPAQANVVQFSPDSTRLASGGEDGIVRIWDFADGEQFAEFDYETAITSLTFRSDGAWIAVGGLSETVRIWEISSGNLLYEWSLE